MTASYEQAWDFYPCRVDDAPASIFLDLGYGAVAPLADADTLYVIRVTMQSPAEHGMGDEGEAAAMRAAEAVLLEGLSQQALHYLGTVRTGGIWQWTLMGGAGGDDAVASAVTQALAPTGHEHELLVALDPKWSYYTGFLMPNEERLQWIQDRQLVDQLTQHGDTLQAPRPVDHWIDFAEPVGVEPFLAEAIELGFTGGRGEAEEGGAGAGQVRVQREDRVDLDSIHEVVMLLHRLADRHSGVYDGWETSVVQP